jgi:alpha-beta hydrolase superfamily lysophospholipase
MTEPITVTEAFEKFTDHYKNRLQQVESILRDNVNEIKKHFSVRSEKLKPNNYPMIFSHEEKTQDVIVLTHGLTDSPYYMQAIGERFYQEGLNVVLPLLPAHGLKEPDEEMKDKNLDTLWRGEIDSAVEVALLLGDRVSLGGFSTGGALSLNKILKADGNIGGGLFLFSAAVDLGNKDEIGDLGFITPFVETILQKVEGKLAGIGPNPFKYPALPISTGIELCQVIQDNERKLNEWEDNDKKISNPVFAAHSVHDDTLKEAGTSGIIELLKNHVTNGLAFLIANTVLIDSKFHHVRHEEVVLAKDIHINPQFKEWKNSKQPRANPQFALMMDTAIDFFNGSVRSSH